MKKLFLYVLLFVGIFTLCYILANQYFQIKMQEKQGNRLEIVEDSIALETEASSGKYVAAIREGRVIVYDADTEQVYEYTDIDAEILKQLHPEIYEDLQENVVFQSKQELYRYLESLSS